MLAQFVCWLALGRPVAFPAQAPPAEIARGERVYTQAKGIERVLMEDRQVLGTWFDGRVRKDVEWAVWLSPSMVARWLGYLSAKEKWAAGALDRRWQAVRGSLDGKATFVVRLSAMPSLSGLDMEAEQPGDESEVVDVRFLFTSGPGFPEAHDRWDWPWDRDRKVARYDRSSDASAPLRVEPAVKLLDVWQSRDRAIFEQYRWLDVLPECAMLRPATAARSPERPLPFGDYRAAWYVVSVDLAGTQLHPGGFDLRVFSRRKERIAHFTLR